MSRIKKLSFFVFVLFFFTFFACGSSDIDTVKKGFLPFDRGITFGAAIENYKYFSSVKCDQEAGRSCINAYLLFQILTQHQ